MAGYGSLGQRQTRPMDRALTDSARRSLVALADGLAADPESGTRVLHTLVELCSDSSVRHDGSPTTGVAAEHRWTRRSPARGRCLGRSAPTAEPDGLLELTC
jgi:hypothetical protein